MLYRINFVLSTKPLLAGAIRICRSPAETWLRANQAVNASIFPDARVDRVAPLPSASPSGPPGSVRVVDFTLFGQRFQAISAGPHPEFNDAISLIVTCDDQAELDRCWGALLEGGGRPQARGWLIDRFGVRWQLVPAALDAMLAAPEPARSLRVARTL